MVRLILLTGAWLLMRRYIFRRRTRIERDTFLSKMTEKLRALAQFRPRRPTRKAPQPTSAVLVEATGSTRQPDLARAFQPALARVRASSASASSFRSGCRQRSNDFVPGL
jgi:hypothetical protein